MRIICRLLSGLTLLLIPVLAVAQDFPARPIKLKELFFSMDRSVTAPVYARADMSPGSTIDGPALVVQLDATTVIPPRWRASVDQFGNLVLEIVK